MEFEDNVMDLLPTYSFTLSKKHAPKRFLDRALNLRNVKEVVYDGYPIDVNTKDNIVVFMYRLKIGKGDYRPIHAVCEIDKKNKRIILITLYDPRSHAWKWDENYEKRVCFCKK